MNAQNIREHLGTLCSHVTFDYAGKPCGIDPLAYDHFDMRCGEAAFVATSLDSAMSQPLFDGKSLAEIAGKIEKIDY